MSIMNEGLHCSNCALIFLPMGGGAFKLLVWTGDIRRTVPLLYIGSGVSYLWVGDMQLSDWGKHKPLLF